MGEERRRRRGEGCGECRGGEVKRKVERRGWRGESFIGLGPPEKFHELCCEWFVLSSTRTCHMFACEQLMLMMLGRFGGLGRSHCS